jgi:hypothetical protein
MHSLLYYELRTPSFDTEWAAQAQARADLRRIAVARAAAATPPAGIRPAPAATRRTVPDASLLGLTGSRPV